MIVTVEAPRFPHAFTHDEGLKLIGTTNALVWAETFVRMLEDGVFEPDGIDVDLMLTWFANAIGVGQLNP